MSVFVTDTHPVIWFFGGKHGNLSKAALKAFTEAEDGNGFIYIPSVVLWEAAILERKGRIKLVGGFPRWVETVLKNSGFGIAPLDAAVINSAVGYNFNNDPFDNVIVVTADELSVPLITKDAAITDSNLVENHW